LWCDCGVDAINKPIEDHRIDALSQGITFIDCLDWNEKVEEGKTTIVRRDLMDSLRLHNHRATDMHVVLGKNSQEVDFIQTKKGTCSSKAFLPNAMNSAHKSFSVFVKMDISKM
jgi:hypothetical protein